MRSFFKTILTSAPMLTLCLALLGTIPAATPAAASWWNPFSWWSTPPAPPSAQELIEGRSILRRQKPDTKKYMRILIEKYREFGASEGEVTNFVEQLERQFNKTGSRTDLWQGWFIASAYAQTEVICPIISPPTTAVCVSGLAVKAIGLSIGLTSGAAAVKLGQMHDNAMAGDPCEIDPETCKGIWSGGGSRGQFLRNKMKHIENQTAAGGFRSVTGTVTKQEAYILGRQWVGSGYRVSKFGPNNTKVYISRDGLRQWRAPSQKTGINPKTQRPWSKTGWQVNFESRATRGGKWTNNIHLDVKGM